jgi:hypothetical protein
VVALTAVFTGMVLALQSYTGFARFNAEGAVANVVVLSITRELGPRAWPSLMVAGRIGAAFAAEIGTMRVTDQIDALTTLSTNPMKYLVAPRLLAGTLALPLLVVVADILGVMGGWLIGTHAPRLRLRRLSEGDDGLPAGLMDVDLGAGEGRGLRLRRDADGLLVRLQFGRRRAGRGARDDDGRGRQLDPDPRDRLRADGDDVLRAMSGAERAEGAQTPPRAEGAQTPKIRLRGLQKAFGREGGAGRRGPRHPRRPFGMVILGGSGSGKSVTLKCILGLITPDAGTIEIDGQEHPGDALASGARGGERPHRHAVPERRAVRQPAGLGECLLQAAGAEAASRAAPRARRRPRCWRRSAWRRAVGDLSPAELSGGMQKRVGLARAIAAEPDIIFFDEPTTGLDPDHGRCDRRPDRGCA